MGTEEWIFYESNPNLKIQKGKKIRVLIRFPFFLTHKIGSLFSPASKPKKDVVPNLCIAGLAVKKRTPDFNFFYRFSKQSGSGVPAALVHGSSRSVPTTQGALLPIKMAFSIPILPGASRPKN